MKRLAIVLPLVLLFASPALASFDPAAYSRTPSGSGIVVSQGTSFTFNLVSDSGDISDSDQSANVELDFNTGSSNDVDSPDYIANSFVSQCVPITVVGGNTSFSITATPPSGKYSRVKVTSFIGTGCDPDNQDNGGTVEYGFTFPPEYPDGLLVPIFVVQSTSQNNGGFLGSSTPGILLTSVATGVTSTGTAIWPLLAFLGIYAAFFIAWKVVTFIRESNKIKLSKTREHMSIADTASQYYDETYTPEQRAAITRKITELGDRESFDE